MRSLVAAVLVVLFASATPAFAARRHKSSRAKTVKTTTPAKPAKTVKPSTKPMPASVKKAGFSTTPPPPPKKKAASAP